MVRGTQVLKLLLKQITEKTLVIEKIQEGSKSRVKENAHLNTIRWKVMPLKRNMYVCIVFLGGRGDAGFCFHRLSVKCQ